MMWHRPNRKRPTRRRGPIGRRVIPRLEVFEPRVVLSGTGFLQGTVYLDSTANQVGTPDNSYPNPFTPATAGTALPGATLELFQGTTVPDPPVNPYMHTTSGPDGSYSFSGLEPGTYTILEIPPAGYGSQGTAVQSPLNPVTATTANSITVQVVDPTSLSVSYDSGDPYQANSTTGQYGRISGAVQFTFVDGANSTTEQFSIGQIPVTVSGAGLPTTQEFTTFCVDLVNSLGFTPDTFPATGQPGGSSINAAGNAGRIGYLYDQYITYLVDQFGQPISNTSWAATDPMTPEQGYEAQAMQVAIWKMVYDPAPSTPLSTDPSDPAFQAFWTTGNVKDFSLLNGVGITNDPAGINDLLARATQFINDSLGQSEPAIVLKAGASSQGYQDLIAPGSLDFTNLPLASVSTTIDGAATHQPIVGDQPVGTSVYDTSKVTGTAGTPTGSVTYYFYDTANPVYGVTTPVSTQTVTLGGGVVPDSSPTAALTPGGYSYIAVYGGDSHYAMTVGDVEPLTIDQASPSITTQTNVYSEVVDTAALKDTAFLTGGDNPTGQIVFTLYSPTGAVVDQERVAVNGDGSYTTPNGYVPTQTGTYYWVATYSGDTNNAGVASGPTDEPVTVTPPSNGIGKGDFATMGFWHNKNGQSLIDQLDGGGKQGTATDLGNWLATNFPHLYGAQADPGNPYEANLTDKTNAQVASFFLTLFNASGNAKTYAQIMSVALASYATDAALAGGNYAASFGFDMVVGGTGTDRYDLGASLTVLGLSNSKTYSVLDLLVAVDALGSAKINSNLGTIESIFDGINTKGDIS